jgi:ABC-type phosphate transport system auxiliary subunit
MAVLPIPEDIARQLIAIAEREGRPLADLMQEFIQQRRPPQIEQAADKEQYQTAPGSLARLAEVAAEMDYVAAETDIADRSREILNTEFADYLQEKKRRWSED